MTSERRTVTNGVIVVSDQLNIGTPRTVSSRAGNNGRFDHRSSFASGAVQVGPAIFAYEVDQLKWQYPQKEKRDE